MPSSQTAPFWQGSDSHSSMLTEQFSPVDEKLTLTLETPVSRAGCCPLTCEAWVALAEVPS